MYCYRNAKMYNGAQRYFCLCAQPVPMRLEARNGRNERHHGFPRLTLPFPYNRRTFMAQLMNAKQPLPNLYPEVKKIIARLPIKPKKAVGSAKKRFVQPVRLASGDLNMKTTGGKGLMSLDN
jgi:hypothetical protein